MCTQYCDLLGSGQHNQRNHLQSLVFEDMHVSGEAMVAIAPALSAHPQLEKLGMLSRNLSLNMGSVRSTNEGLDMVHLSGG